MLQDIMLQSVQSYHLQYTLQYRIAFKWHIIALESHNIPFESHSITDILIVSTLSYHTIAENNIAYSMILTRFRMLVFIRINVHIADLASYHFERLGTLLCMEEY